MKYICDREQMQQIDKFSMEDIGIPSVVLMERAAFSVFEEIKKRFGCRASCLLLVGAGNNGGDGLALLRILYEAGYDVLALCIGNHKRSRECEAQLNRIHSMQRHGTDALGITWVETAEQAKGFLLSKAYDVVIDSIFGIGLSRDIVSPEREVIEMANEMQGLKIALDIPSGLNANTGAVQGTAFSADITVTFGYLKKGMLLGRGPDICGEVLVKNIGFPNIAADYAGLDTFTYDRDDLVRLPKRMQTSNKGTYGRVAVIAGCETMAGAAYFSAAAAYRSGAGLVKVYTHSCNRDIILSKLPEAVFEAYDVAKISPEQTEAQSAQAARVVQSAASFADAMVVGPGLGRSFMSECLVKEALIQEECPVILDADGLNILAEHRDWLSICRTKVIVTPHLKEMERLTGKSLAYINENTISQAMQLVEEYDMICVLKGAHTIVAGKSCDTYINTTGNHGMSTGGTGDVLTGIIAAMVAAGTELTEAARLGVMLHGMAADNIAEARSMRGMLAGDLLDGLCSVFAEAESICREK